ncbi:MAG: YhbY family RNA-binding protein [Burkholderiales bacterium]|nr:YhbY family RNA-binding protein [Burkholderiales bacterium]
MSELTPHDRRALRARAHHLHPVVSIGQHGLTPRVLHEIDVALTAHGLIKVRVHSDDRAAREAMLAQVCAQLHCVPVQHLGKLLIVWRARDEDDAPGAPATPRKAARAPEAGAAAGAPRRRRADAAVGGRDPSTRPAAFGTPRAKPRGTGYLTRGDAKAGRPPRDLARSARPPRLRVRSPVVAEPASAPAGKRGAAAKPKAAGADRRGGTVQAKPLPAERRGSAVNPKAAPAARRGRTAQAKPAPAERRGRARTARTGSGNAGAAGEVRAVARPPRRRRG